MYASLRNVEIVILKSTSSAIMNIYLNHNMGDIISSSVMTNIYEFCSINQVNKADNLKAFIKRTFE